MYNELIKRQGVYNNDQVNIQFFSAQNIDIIQKNIQSNVYKNTNQKIGKQSETELFIIMQSIHRQHSRNIPTHIQEQVDELNEIVANEATRLITPRLLQHISYLEELNTGRKFMEYAQNTSSVGEKY